MGDILELAERFWQGQFPPRDLWRPTHKSEALAARAGGVEVLTNRARALAESGSFAPACHVNDWAAAAAPDSTPVQAARADIYESRPW